MPFCVMKVKLMKFADHLSKEQIRKFNQLRKANRNQKEHKPKKKIDERLSKRDLEELMNVHMDTYVRKNGAVRRK